MKEALRLRRGGIPLLHMENVTKVPRRTLERYLNNDERPPPVPNVSDASLDVSRSGPNVSNAIAMPKKLGRRTVLSAEEEEDLVRRIIRLAEVGCP